MHEIMAPGSGVNLDFGSGTPYMSIEGLRKCRGGQHSDHLKFPEMQKREN